MNVGSQTLHVNIGRRAFDKIGDLQNKGLQCGARLLRARRPCSYSRTDKEGGHVSECHVGCHVDFIGPGRYNHHQPESRPASNLSEAWLIPTSVYGSLSAQPSTTTHICTYPQIPSLLFHHLPSSYEDPAQSQGIDFASTQNRLLGLCDTMETLDPPSPSSHPKLETNIHVEVADSSGEAQVDEGDDSLRGVLLPEPHSSITIAPTTTTTKTIESSDLPLESINNIHSGNRLPPSVLGVSNSIANNVPEKVTTSRITFPRKFLRTLRVFS